MVVPLVMMGAVAVAGTLLGGAFGSGSKKETTIETRNETNTQNSWSSQDSVQNTFTDSRSSVQDFTDSRTIIINSPNARASSFFKKELSSNPSNAVTPTSSLALLPSNSVARPESRTESNGLDVGKLALQLGILAVGGGLAYAYVTK